nr:hypothetical protein [Saccharomonospora halophila]
MKAAWLASVFADGSSVASPRSTTRRSGSAASWWRPLKVADIAAKCSSTTRVAGSSSNARIRAASCAMAQ